MLLCGCVCVCEAESILLADWEVLNMFAELAGSLGETPHDDSLHLLRVLDILLDLLIWCCCLFAGQKIHFGAGPDFADANIPTARVARNGFLFLSDGNKWPPGFTLLSRVFEALETDLTKSKFSIW